MGTDNAGEERERNAGDEEAVDNDVTDDALPEEPGGPKPDDPDADPDMQRGGDARTVPQSEGDDTEDPDADPDMLR